jgi:hypothetical protein
MRGANGWDQHYLFLLLDPPGYMLRRIRNQPG